MARPKKIKVVVDDKVIDNPEEVKIEDVVREEVKGIPEGKQKLLDLLSILQELNITRIADLENMIANFR